MKVGRWHLFTTRTWEPSLGLFGVFGVHRWRGDCDLPDALT